MEFSDLSQEHFCIALTDDTGKGSTEIFQVFPGIYLMYNEFHMEHCQSSYAPAGDFWGIEYCHSGNTEWKLENGDYAYLGAQTLMSCDYRECGEDFSFPGRLFEGIALGFEMPLAETSIPGALGINLFQLKENISAAALVDLAGKVEIEAALKLLYAARNQTDLHRKLAVAHFLVYLSDLEPNQLEPIYMGKQAAEKIKNIEAFLRGDLEHRWTLRELSDRFGVSVSVLRRNLRASLASLWPTICGGSGQKKPRSCCWAPQSPSEKLRQSWAMRMPVNLPSLSAHTRGFRPVGLGEILMTSRS